MVWTVVGYIAAGVVGGGLGFLLAVWSMRRRRLFEQAQNCFVMAAYYLSTIKAFKEDKDALAQSGIGMMARINVQSWKRLKSRLSEKQTQEIIKRNSLMWELVKDAEAEAVCGETD